MADVIARLSEHRLAAVLRIPRAELAERVVAALVAGGVEVVELTFTTPGVEAALAHVRDRHPGLLLGAGTIRDEGQARRAAAAGADFLVMPHLEPRLLGICRATGLPALPGVLTPSEVALALAEGADLLKLFPAGSAGPAHLKALRGPFPELRVVPTGGIGLEDIPAWIEAGALAVGVGGELCPGALVEEQRLGELTERARRFVSVAGRGATAR
jgi:2-dehydro-3-deoxyphosphogluconate aldolase / (4S)-4-hydroxy-2-oxoglutarate aldolase